MRKNSELMVITKSKDIVNYIFTISENSPKKFRFSILPRIQNTALEVLENLLLANETPLYEDSENKLIRRNYQQKAIAKLKILDAFIFLAREQKCFLPKQYEVLSRMLTDCLNLTGAWIKSDRNRTG